MTKESDWNDKAKKDEEAAKKLFDEIESQHLDIANISKLEDYDKTLKVINELNSKHIFINTIGGVSFITNKIFNEVTEREELEFLKLDTFKNIYSNRFIKDDTNRDVPIGHFWINCSRRKTVDSIIFDPASSEAIVERNNRSYLNLWEGFSCEPEEGNWGHTKRHIHRILCNSDPHKFKYVIKWLAWLVQNPDKRAEVALVFQGEKGAGKSFLFVQFKKIFARHGMVISDPNRLTGKFSNHFQGLCFLFCDEVYYPGNKEIEGRMKTIITEEFMDVESKFRDAISIRNRLHLVMCTNNEWVIPASKDERRYFVEEINNKYAKGRASELARKTYFSKLWSEMENGGREAMLFDLISYNLKGWHPRDDVPTTSALVKQKDMSLNALQQSMKSLLEDGVLPGDFINLTYWISAESFKNYVEKQDPYCARFSTVKKADLMKKLGAKKCRTPGSGNIRWEFPELKKMRRNWDKEFGPNYWDTLDKWVMTKGEF